MWGLPFSMIGNKERKRIALTLLQILVALDALLAFSVNVAVHKADLFHRTFGRLKLCQLFHSLVT